MRKALLAVLAAGSLLAGLVGMASPAQSAELIVDFGVDVVSNPTVVSPPGETVEYRITVTNYSPISSSAIVTDTTTNGSLVSAPAGCSAPAPGTVNPTVTCNVTVAAGASVELDVTIATASTPGVTSNAATVEVQSTVLNPVLDLNQANNTDTADTTVNAADGTGGSSAFLQKNESLRFRGHLLTVLDVYGSSGGVSVRLADSVVTAGTQCGTTACNDEGLNVTYNDGERNVDGSWQRSGGLVEIDVFFGSQDPCYGKGNPDCFSLYYRVAPTDTAQPVASCVGGMPTEGAGPCIVRVYKEGELFHQVVRMFTNDPDLLEPIKSLKPTSSG